jgi:Flp pilus assembly protein TadD
VDVAFVNNGNIYDTYGWAKFLAGDTEGAITELQRAVQIEPIALAYLHLAMALEKNEQVPEARKVLQEGINFARQRQDPALKELEAAMQKLR